MAASNTKAEHRSADLMAAIRENLGEGSFCKAVYDAQNAILSELAKLRDHRPADAALIHAEIAGALAVVAKRLHLQKPIRPAGYSKGAPQPEHLLAVFETAVGRSEKKAAVTNG